MRPILFAIVLSTAGCASHGGRSASSSAVNDSPATGVLSRGAREQFRVEAIAVLKQASVSPEYRWDALLTLSTSGRAGLRALEALSRSDGSLGRAAAVASERFHRFDEAKVRRCATDSDAGVRRLCLFLHHSRMPADLLRGLMRDTDPTVRRYAVKGVGSLPVEIAVELGAAGALARDPASAVRLEAARLGARLGDDALHLLRACFDSESKGLRLAAVTGLDRLDTEDSLALLRSLAGGPADTVALTAAALLSARGDKTAQNRFLSAFEDERTFVRTAAAYLSGTARIPGRGERLAGLLDDAAPEVALAAADLLRNDEAVRGRVMETLRRIAAGDEHSAKMAQTLAARLGDANAIAALHTGLREAQEDEPALLDALRRGTGVEALLGEVVRFLDDPRESVRVRAATAVLSSPPKI